MNLFKTVSVPLFVLAGALSACGGSSSVAVIAPTDPAAVSSALDISRDGVAAVRKSGELPATTSDAEVISSASTSEVVKNGSNLPLTLDSAEPLRALLIKVVGSTDYFELDVSSPSDAKAISSSYSVDFAIPENITDGEFCIKVAGINVSDVVSNVIEVCITIESTIDDETPAPSTSVVGTWIADDVQDDLLVFTFYDDGTYVHSEVDLDDQTEISGMERGTYTIDSGTNDVAVVITFDNNGDTGLTDTANDVSNLRLSASGDTLTADFDDDLDGTFEGSISFHRATSAGIFGTWLADDAKDDFLAFTFFEDGTYIHQEIDVDDETEISGMEWGDYSIDADTNDVTVTIRFDNNGDTGLTDSANGDSNLRISVSGDTLTAEFDDDLDGVFEGSLTFSRKN